MIITIQSENPFLLDILNKNPDSDNGIYATPLRNGNIVAASSNDDIPTCCIRFFDKGYSYVKDKSSQMDYKSLCSPETSLGIVNELFNHLLKDINEIKEKECPWLNKVYGELDNESANYNTQIRLLFEVTSNWYRDGQFLLSKYIPEVRLIKEDGMAKSIFILEINSTSVIKAINILSLVSFMCAISNDNDFFIDNAQVEKYARVLTNIPTVPYFIYYLFIKRACIKSEKVYEKIVPSLEAAYEKYNDVKVSFTRNGTHEDRIQWVKSVINYEKPILNYGCGEFRYEKALGKRMKNSMHSYDIVDYSELHEKFSQRYDMEWYFYNKVEDIPPLPNVNDKYQIILSEVIEHNQPDEIKRELDDIIQTFDNDCIIITTPNKNFNKHYQMDTEFRNDDHVFEFTHGEFVEFMNQFEGEKTFYKIGDCIGEDSVTSACILKTV